MRPCLPSSVFRVYPLHDLWYCIWLCCVCAHRYQHSRQLVEALNSFFGDFDSACCTSLFYQLSLIEWELLAHHLKRMELEYKFATFVLQYNEQVIM